MGPQSPEHINEGLHHVEMEDKLGKQGMAGNTPHVSAPRIDENARARIIHDTLEQQGLSVDLISQMTRTEVVKTADGGVVPQIFKEISGTGMSPWEIHRPQQAVMELAKTGVFQRRSVLDIGCGIGDNALYLARYCHSEVTAIDFVPRAIDFALKKEALRVGMRGRVRWLVGDILNPHNPQLADCTFDVLLDMLTFQCFSNTEREAYVQCVNQLARRGTVLLILAASDKWPMYRQGGPRRVSKAELHAIFNADSGWCVESIAENVMEHHPSFNSEEAKAVTDPRKDPKRWTHVWRGYVEAYLATIRKL